MLALGMALEKTKGAELIAQAISNELGSWGAAAVLAAIVLIASVMTTFLSNYAVAVLMTPVVIPAAELP